VLARVAGWANPLTRKGQTPPYESLLERFTVGDDGLAGALAAMPSMWSHGMAVLL